MAIEMVDMEDGVGGAGASKSSAGRLSLGWIVALNVLLSATQIIVGTSIRSLVLVSDGAHNFSDAVAAIVAQFAEAVDGGDYDREKLPFGYARATCVGALVNVAALEALCLSIALSALCRFYKPEAVTDLEILAVVSAVGVVANVASAVLACFGVKGAHVHHHHVHFGGGACGHEPLARPGAVGSGTKWQMLCGSACCGPEAMGGPPAALGFKRGQIGVQFTKLATDDVSVCVPCAPCAPPPETADPADEANDEAISPPFALPRLDVGRVALVLHHVGDAATCVLVLGEALLLKYGPRVLSTRVMRGLGLYLDPALSLALSLFIAAAAWPVGTRAAWTLLEGAPPDGAVALAKDDLEAALGGRATVDACVLLHLRDAPAVERCAMVRLTAVDDDKDAHETMLTLKGRRATVRRREPLEAAARRVLRRFGADDHVFVDVARPPSRPPSRQLT